MKNCRATNRMIFSRHNIKTEQLSSYESLPRMSRSKKYDSLENCIFTGYYGRSQKAEGPQTRMKVD